MLAEKGKFEQIRKCPTLTNRAPFGTAQDKWSTRKT